MVDNGIRLGGGRYEIRSLIGRGGMAEVHKGYDNLLSRIVAIKMLRVDLAKDAIFLARFRREAQASASLNHENIVGVYDTGEHVVTIPSGMEVSVPYIVMEYVEGHTVHELLNDGQPVPINEAVEITVGILNALEYSHSKGLVHRDIKPGNVMLTNNGKIKVMDFGIARALEDSGATMTQADAVVGTAQYLSPEQARGEQVDTRSDLYSCGCILFELLTGRPPFRGDSAVSVAYQHVAENPPLPSAITSDIPAALDRVVLKALSKQVDSRYGDAASMRNDLIRAAGGLEVSAPPLPAATAVTPKAGLPTAPAATSMLEPRAWNPTSIPAPNPQAQEAERPGQTKQKKKNSLAWMWALILLLIIAIGGGTWYYLSTRESAPETVTIPSSIIGMSQSQADAALSELGLQVETGETIASDTIESGKVAATDPPAGSTVQVGSTVTLQLSSGSDQVTVPDVSGLSQDQARDRIEQTELAVGSVTTEDDPQVEEGKVIRTDPESGTALTKGEKIKLVISSGYVTIDSSKVVGQSKETGLEYLRSLGLSTDTSTVTSTTLPTGQIASISPEGRVKVGSTITVQVAEAKVEETTATPSSSASTAPSSSKPTSGTSSGSENDSSSSDR